MLAAGNQVRQTIGIPPRESFTALVGIIPITVIRARLGQPNLARLWFTTNQ